MNNSDIYIDINNTNIILNGGFWVTSMIYNGCKNNKIVPYLILN